MINTIPESYHKKSAKLKFVSILYQKLTFAVKGKKKFVKTYLNLQSSLLNFGLAGVLAGVVTSLCGTAFD